jgi:hypothetical protein
MPAEGEALGGEMASWGFWGGLALREEPGCGGGERPRKFLGVGWIMGQKGAGFKKNGHNCPVSGAGADGQVKGQETNPAL